MGRRGCMRRCGKPPCTADSLPKSTGRVSLRAAETARSGPSGLGRFGAAASLIDCFEDREADRGRKIDKPHVLPKPLLATFRHEHGDGPVGERLAHGPDARKIQRHGSISCSCLRGDIKSQGGCPLPTGEIGSKRLGDFDSVRHSPNLSAKPSNAARRAVVASDTCGTGSSTSIATPCQRGSMKSYDRPTAPTKYQHCPAPEAESLEVST